MSAAAQLRLSYRPDNQWHGELSASVNSGAFSGTSSAWFDRAKLDTFVAALRAFPLSPDAPPLIESGFGSKETPGALEQCHLRIAIRPYDSRGSLLVQVDLASKSWSSPDKDRQQEVTARFLTQYSELDEFASQLSKVLDGKGEFAILYGVRS